jgi:NitT/TauT family transport system ATP-binding protein
LEEFIRLDRVGMTYPAASGAVEALRDIDLAVARGELVAIVGPSGCGKSTLLRIIAGLRRATSGRVVVEGREVIAPIPAVGMVFQAPVLLKWRTIEANVLLPAELSGSSPGSCRGSCRVACSSAPPCAAPSSSTRRSSSWTSRSAPLTR